MKAVLALDQGTTSSRAAVVGVDGNVYGFAQREVPQIFPQSGWVEHDPRALWETQLEAARAALALAGVPACDIAAIGIANQRETTILWERASGRPIGNAIVWQDRRSAPLCESLAQRGCAERVRDVTGLVLDPYFSATKIAWLLECDPALRRRAERGEIAFGTVDSWLVWNLTGGTRHVTDASNASRTLLFDLRALAWSDEMLALFGVPRALLPAVLPSVALFGTAQAHWFGAEIAVAAVAGDQQAALAGQAGFAPGAAKNTYGTGSFVVLNTGAHIVRSAAGMLATVGCALERATTYALEGSIFTTGAALQWLRDGLGIIAAAAESDALARSVPDTAGVFFVPALAGLGAPYWDPHARGALVGLSRGTTRAHVVRAALEAMAYQTADVVRAMERDAGAPLRELRVDGGAAANDFAMQFQADILNVPVVRPATRETTALGAAYLAGLQCGLWPSVDALCALWKEDRRFVPAMDERTRERLCAQWARAVAAARSAASPAP